MIPELTDAVFKKRGYALPGIFELVLIWNLISVLIPTGTTSVNDVVMFSQYMGQCWGSYSGKNFTVSVGI